MDMDLVELTVGHYLGCSKQSAYEVAEILWAFFGGVLSPNNIQESYSMRHTLFPRKGGMFGF